MNTTKKDIRSVIVHGRWGKKIINKLRQKAKLNRDRDVRKMLNGQEEKTGETGKGRVKVRGVRRP